MQFPTINCVVLHDLFVKWLFYANVLRIRFSVLVIIISS